jgi:TRAP-type C4-dicarboxylate transport system permease small subunit
MLFLIKKIKSVNIYIYKISEWVGIILLFSIFIIMITGVISRYCLGWSLPWPDEVSTFLFTWVCLIGANLGLKDHGHLGVTLLIGYLPSSIGNWVIFITDCLIGFFSGFLFIYGWKNAIFFGGGLKTPFLNIPYTYLYLSVSVGGLFLTIQAIFLIKDDVKKILSYKTGK